MQPRIVRNFDRVFPRDEPARQIERYRGRMIEGAGVQPDAPDIGRPRPLQHLLHEKAAGARARRLVDNAEHGDLDFTGHGKAQFGKADRLFRVLEHVDLDCRRGKSRLQGRVGHHRP